MKSVTKAMTVVAGFGFAAAALTPPVALDRTRR
jgi:hypothetical protein